MSDTDGQGPDFSGSGPVEYRPSTSAPRGNVEAALAREEARLLAIPGVVAVGRGSGPIGREILTVSVTDAGVAALVPREIDGIPIVITVTGPIDALPQR